MKTIESVKKNAENDAKTHGYFLTPDKTLFNELLDGLKKNEERYGYQSCPCRLASGNIEFDRDIICPCDYRDPDVEEYGQCYCALYVNKDVHDGKKGIQQIPERRPTEKQVRAYTSSNEPSTATIAEKKERTEKVFQTKIKLWYCKQCGYVCFREDPPYSCPICKAKREMFTELEITTIFH